MQQLIQKFVFLCESVLSEPGELTSRRNWSELSSVATDLSPYMKQLTQNFSPKYGLLFLIGCNAEESLKATCFSILFRKLLSNIPSRDLLDVLKYARRNDLNNYLLPFLYEKGNLGSVASYVTARLELKVQYEAFEFFLKSRDWSKEDLVNLSLLVATDEKALLINSLEELQKIEIKENRAEFINVLKSSKVTEAVIPDLNNTNPFKQEKKPVPKPSSEQKTGFNSFVNKSKASNTFVTGITNVNKAKNENKSIKEPNNSGLHAQANESNSVSAEDTEQKPELNMQAKENNLNKRSFKAGNYLSKLLDSKTRKIVCDKFKDLCESLTDKLDNFGNSRVAIPVVLKQGFSSKLIGIVSLVVAITLLVIFLTVNSSNTDSEKIKIPPKEGTIPEYWVDAVTNKKITHKYLTADIDYRMGELYLTRGLYNEAIQNFSSACQIDSTHYIAKMRWGYAVLLQGNSAKAKILLNEAYQGEPTLQNLNLYLARAYSMDNDTESAIEHYKEEYKNFKELDTGMELANYLASIDRQNDAMDMISVLQEAYPDKMLVLDPVKSKRKTK